MKSTSSAGKYERKDYKPRGFLVTALPVAG